MSDIRQFTPVFFLQLSRIARQGLSLCTAKIVFFPEVSLSVVDAMLLKRYLLAENAEDATYNTVWDWNQDETCDVLDVVGLTKFLLRKD